ncbi:hypothetical protein SynWH8101_1080 [Synechococcus sp. WH 8101]|nr:hypothetical protein SynWH8101_1080 [Synechococcus sp. WH 8101]QNI44887.1 putative membrane protein [Synechococcus sp. WH 8101]
MQHLGRDQYNHSLLGCLIQVFLATGIQQLLLAAGRAPH